MYMMNNRLTSEALNRYLDDFSRERGELMKELKDATTVANETPIRQKLQAVQAVESNLLKIRTIIRKEQEKIM